MHGAELVDLSVAPQERRALRRQRVLRVGVPILSVALLIGAILGIALFTYESNRRGASVLSDDFLRSLEKRIATEVASYLAPAPKMARFARETLGGASFSPDGIERAQRFGRDLLNSYDQISSVYVADGNGQFLMVSRKAEEATETKLITLASSGKRHVRLIRRDALGEIVDAQDLQDDFDPRTRPWYRGAVNARGLYWTDVYVFFTERTPGVTAALPLIPADGGIATVYGIDITLGALSSFLKGIEIGTTGRAMIVDAEGRLIASPEPDRVLREDSGALVARRLDELGDLALTRVFNRLRIEGHGHGTVDVDGERVIFASTALPIGADKNWSVVIVVPEREIIGFVATNNRTALLISLSIIGIAAALAGLLVRQGIRADRNAQLASERQEAIEAQSRSFAALADSAASLNPGERRGMPALAERLAEATAARRTSVWRLAHGGRSLLCEDCFDRESKTHTAGVELHRSELPQVWDLLSTGEVLDVTDAARDPRTSGLFHVYMRPLSIQALMAVPIERGGEIIGSIWLEDLPPAEKRPAGVESFARTAAHMEAARATPAPDVPDAAEALRLARNEAADRKETITDEPRCDYEVPGTPASRRETAVDAGRQDVLSRSRAPADAVEVFPTVTTLTVFVPDDSEPGKRAAPGNGDAAVIDTARAGTTAADAVARVLENVADTHAIPYLKVLGNCVVAAAGFSGEPGPAARAVARAALTLREAGDPSTSGLRMGIDTGVALGSPVGRDRQCYNLWGAAARRATELARSAPLGGIQVTASTYQHLVDEFLFRPRGGFYVHPEGETATYLLAGRL